MRNARSVQSKLETRKKRLEPHMWILFRVPTGGYGVSIGDPRLPSSRLKATFSNKHGLKDWVLSNVGHTVSADHVFDATGLRLVPSTHSDFYMQARK